MLLIKREIQNISENANLNQKRSRFVVCEEALCVRLPYSFDISYKFDITTF